MSSFLQTQAPGYEPPKLPGKKVLLHGHCHHRAILPFSHEEALIKRMGVELKSLDSGCCGMAGPFGFERSKFKISQALGERVLLPAVRGADPDTLIVTDGFSCREQVEQNTGRKPLHIAELLRLGMGEPIADSRMGETGNCQDGCGPRDLSRRDSALSNPFGIN
jgi:Fe-S oxidoreductase